MTIYAGAWSPDGPTRKIELHHVSDVELSAICERVAASLMAVGFAPGTPELDEATAETVFHQLEAIERDRSAKAQTAEAKQQRRATLRVVK